MKISGEGNDASRTLLYGYPGVGRRHALANPTWIEQHDLSRNLSPWFYYQGGGGVSRRKI